MTAKKLTGQAKPPRTAAETTAVIFPEEQVGPYRFRPWSMEQFSLLVPVLLQLVASLEVAKIPPEQFQARAFEVLPLLTPLLPQLIGITLGLAPGEYEGIAMGHRMALGLRILINQENQDQIKNFLTGFMGKSRNPVKNH